MPYLSSAGIIYIDRRKVLALARKLAEQILVAHPEVHKVVLIGSFAGGRGGPRSDLDLVVFVTRSELQPRDRVEFYMPTSPHPIDMVVYTDEEIREFSSNPPPILRAALEKGVVLAEKDRLV